MSSTRPDAARRRASALLHRLVAALSLVLLVGVPPAAAQSVLRDAETEAFFADMAAPLVTAAGLSPRTVKVVLIQDDAINAFVAGGQIVYLQSGLLQAADTANQVQGVVAHELGHMAGGHVALADRGTKPAMGMYLLSMVLGVAAMAAGSGDAGAGIMAAGQQAAMGKYLSFSRTQESTADSMGVRFLSTSGISGRGMLEFFKKLQQEEYRYGVENIDPFMQSHPLSGDRIQTLQADVQASAAYKTPSNPALEERFRRVKAKLQGYVAPMADTLKKYPESDQSIYAHYARAYAYHKGGFPEKAEAEVVALRRADPNDPYFAEVAGQILLEGGKPQLALAPLKQAMEGTRSNALVATTYGHALLATENKANYPDAVRVLKIAVARDDDNPFGWRQLGTAYELTGDHARAALATAEQASMTGDTRTAMASARYALANIPANTPDWLRAQDIAMTTGNEMADAKKRKRRQ